MFDDSDRPRATRRPDAASTPMGRQGQRMLVMIHDHLRQEVDRLVLAVDKVASGELEAGAARALIHDSTMRGNYQVTGSFCAQYCQIVEVHHTIEDRRMFVDLADAEPDLEPVIKRLSEEHEVIHDILVGIDRALVGMVNGTGGMTEVAVEVRRLAGALHSHLAYEEAELLDPIGRLTVPI